VNIRWTAEPRAIVIDGDPVVEISVVAGDVVDVPEDTARSLIAQGLAATPRAPKADAPAAPTTPRPRRRTKPSKENT
jgi:hypothetical protein